MPVQSNKSREAIYSALFQLVQQVKASSSYPQIVTYSRRLLDPQSVPNDSLPALVLVEGPNRAIRSMRGIIKWHLSAAIIYFFTPPSIQNSFSNPPWPISQVNDILDQIEITIATKNPDGTPNPFGKPQLLGGLVTDVILESPEFDQASFDMPSGIGWAVFPVIMEVGQ